ncbi:MAG: hypothetical protein IJD97_01340 [Clostridia bacterium]|nr:hypothetical protein [Clostridia bacterium]
MKAGQLFRKTMPFAIAKLVLGAATVLISVVLLAILLGLGWLFGENGMVICIFIWIGATGVVRFAIMHYFGYLVKAGHVAVLAEAVTTGKVPDNQVNYGKEAVKKRFSTSNIYFAVDKLVSGAVKQIQRGISKLGNALDFIPGMGAVTGIANFFVELSLGYVDECCLGYTFYKKEQGAFRSACDGVVIYAQNIKHLLKNAAKTMLKVLLLSLVVLIAVFVPIGLLFKLLSWNAFIGFLLAVFITWVIKFAFLDSYILCQTMASYMEVAPTTEITFDLYGKLSKISGKFKELFNKGKAEEPQMAYAGAGQQNAQPQQKAQPNIQTADAPKTKFCGQCGAKNDAGAGFCGECGAKL